MLTCLCFQPVVWSNGNIWKPPRFETIPRKTASLSLWGFPFLHSRLLWLLPPHDLMSPNICPNIQRESQLKCSQVGKTWRKRLRQFHHKMWRSDFWQDQLKSFRSRSECHRSLCILMFLYHLPPVPTAVSACKPGAEERPRGSLHQDRPWQRFECYGLSVCPGPSRPWAHPTQSGKSIAWFEEVYWDLVYRGWF